MSQTHGLADLIMFHNDIQWEYCNRAESDTVMKSEMGIF